MFFDAKLSRNYSCHEVNQLCTWCNDYFTLSSLRCLARLFSMTMTVFICRYPQLHWHNCVKYTLTKSVNLTLFICQTHCITYYKRSVQTKRRINHFYLIDDCLLIIVFVTRFVLIFSQVYCDGPLLHTVQLSGIFNDSKTFVDLYQLHNPDVTIKK